MAAATAVDRRPSVARRPAAPWAWVVAGCVALAAVSLLAGHETTYDPTAWLIWGREIGHGDLTTTFGPSWKPLPAFVTVPASLLPDGGQQVVWLVVARAGALAGLALAYRLAWRIAGAWAGAIAAAALLLSIGYASRQFRGNSEGLLVALGLGAIEAHLCGRRRSAFALLVALALVRPELWLLTVGYGAFLVWSAAPGRQRLRTVAVTGVAAVAIVALWLVPEKIGSGELLRAATRAQLAVAGQPQGARFPFLATFTNAAPVLPWPVYAAAIALVALALAAARRGARDPATLLTLGLAALATAVMVVVAAMTQGGFTGSTRYLTLPVAITCVLGGAGCVALARLARRRLPARWATAAIVLAALVAAPFVAGTVADRRHDVRGAFDEMRLYAALPDAIARAGGADRLRTCGRAYTAGLDTQAVARALHVHELHVGIHPLLPGALFARRGSALAGDTRFRLLAVTPRWVIRSSCVR